MSDVTNEPDVDSTPAPEVTPEVDPGTLANGNAGDDTPQAVPATWPDDWRTRLAGDDPDDLKTLNKWKTPENLWKQNKSLRAKMSSGEFKVPMPDSEDEDAVKAWRTENGVPDTPDGYKEGLDLENFDEALMEKYFADMHVAGASPEEVQRGLGIYSEMIEASQETQSANDKQYRIEAEEMLRSEWGPEFRANLNSMRNLASAHGTEGLNEVMFSARQADGSLLGDNPDFLKFLVNLDGQLNPHGTITPKTGETVSETIKTELAGIEAEMSKGKNGTYWGDENMQARYRQLLEMNERAA